MVSVGRKREIRKKKNQGPPKSSRNDIRGIMKKFV